MAEETKAADESAEESKIHELSDILEKGPVEDLENKILRNQFSLLGCYKFKSNKDIFARCPPPLKGDLKYHKTQDLYSFHGRIIIPQPFVFDTIEEEFNDLPSSIGAIKFYSYLQQRYIGISFNQVRKFLNTDPEHSEWRLRHRSQKTVPFVSTKPYSEAALDITYLPGGLTHKYLLVIVESFTKFIWAVLLNKQDATSICNAIRETFPDKSHFFKYLRTDNAFKGAEYKELAQEYNFKFKYQAPSNPLAGGMVEASNKNIKTMFFSYLQEQKSEKQRIRPALLRTLQVYNETINSSTGYRPRDLMNPDCPNSILKQSRANMKAKAAGRDVNKKFNYPLRVGDNVKIDVLLLNPAYRAAKKANKFKASHQPTFSNEDYTISEVRKDGLYQIKELPGKYFLRGQLCYVPEPVSREAFVMDWQGKRDDDGKPVGTQDVQGIKLIDGVNPDVKS